MRILHLSDTHGRIPELPYAQYDLIVLSGDILPNSTRGGREEATFQRNWLSQHAEGIAVRLLKDICPVLYCPGNHDFLPPSETCTLLRAAGVNAIDVTAGPYHEDGRAFMGFPWVPPITGEWNYEAPEDDIAHRLAKLPGYDVLISHAPPFSVLDNTGYACAGSHSLLEHIAERKPMGLLCGHIHEAHGFTVLGRTLVSNAATTQQIVELP